MEKHMRICKKVFMEKRKKFDSAANRLGDMENAKDLINKAKKIEQEAKQVKDKEAVKDREENDESGKPMPKWKKKSLEFRAAMLAQKAADGDADAQAKAQAMQNELAVAAPAEVDPDKVKCPHCGRSFNKEAGERHIAICVKTFGSKPGGGRLNKGGGMTGMSGSNPPAPASASASAAAAAPAPARAAPPAGPGGRRNGGAARAGGESAPALPRPLAGASERAASNERGRPAPSTLAPAPRLRRGASQEPPRR